MWKTFFSYVCVAGNAFFYILTYIAFTRRQPSTARAVIFICACSAALGSRQPLLASLDLRYSLVKVIVVIGLSVALFQLSLVTAGCLLLAVRLAQTVGDSLAALLLLVGRCYCLERVCASLVLLTVVQLLRWFVIGLLLLGIYRYRSPDGPPSATTQLTRFFIPGCLSIATCIAIANQATIPDLLYLPGHVLALNCLTSIYCSLGALAFIPLAYKLEAQAIENKHLCFHLRTCEERLTELRRFRHNYRNILHGFGGFIECGQWDELASYFAEVVASSKPVASKPSNSSLLLIRHRPLFGLLSDKMQVAEAHGIPLHLHVEHVIEKLPLAATDLCTILGIFLDNALEAAAAHPSGWVKVHFSQQGTQLHIIISNNYLEVPTLARLYEHGYSSKGTGRGLGLPEVKRILRRYPPILLNTCLENDTFTHELIIPLSM